MGFRLGWQRTKRQPDPSHLEVPHAGEVFRVSVRRVAAARRFTLRVSAATGDVVLTLPYRADFARAADFAQRHGGWIAARVAKLPETVDLLPGAVVPLRGIEYRIENRPNARGTVWEEPRATGRPRLVVSGQPEHAHRRILDFLKREARKDIEAAVLRHTKALGKRATKITLRDTTSRWGSCSTTGRLNFSWRLILAPPFVLDYLAAHEVAHLREMNHSPRFWRLVYKLCENTDEAEAWLKRHGAGLHRFR